MGSYFCTHNMEIYCGQHPEDPYRQINSADSIIVRVSELIFKTVRNITVDNWFASLKVIPELVEKILSNVGSIKKNTTFVSAINWNHDDSLR